MNGRGGRDAACVAGSSNDSAAPFKTTAATSKGYAGETKSSDSFLLSSNLLTPSTAVTGCCHLFSSMRWLEKVDNKRESKRGKTLAANHSKPSEHRHFLFSRESTSRHISLETNRSTHSSAAATSVPFFRFRVCVSCVCVCMRKRLREEKKKKNESPPKIHAQNSF